MMRIFYMILLMFSAVLSFPTEEPRCFYPDYLRNKFWIDQTSGQEHDVIFKKDTLNEHHDEIYAKIDWHCFHHAKEGTSDLVVSRTEVLGEKFFRCELYHKVDDYHVYYKSLQAPYHVTNDVVLDECNICSKKDVTSTLPKHELKSDDANLPSTNTDPVFDCGPSQCNECPATSMRALKDEERSLEYLLRQWLADKYPEK